MRHGAGFFGQLSTNENNAKIVNTITKSEGLLRVVSNQLMLTVIEPFGIVNEKKKKKQFSFSSEFQK